MKVTIQQAFEVEMLYNEFREKPLPIKTAYKISKLNSKLTADTEFYRNHLQEILTKYAETDEEGKFIISDDETSIKIKPNMADACEKEMEELQDMEIEIDFNQKFTLDELEPLNLTLAELTVLAPFIEE